MHIIVRQIVTLVPILSQEDLSIGSETLGNYNFQARGCFNDFFRRPSQEKGRVTQQDPPKPDPFHCKKDYGIGKLGKEVMIVALTSGMLAMLAINMNYEQSCNQGGMTWT